VTPFLFLLWLKLWARPLWLWCIITNMKQPIPHRDRHSPPSKLEPIVWVARLKASIYVETAARILDESRAFVSVDSRPEYSATIGTLRSLASRLEQMQPEWGEPLEELPRHKTRRQNHQRLRQWGYSGQEGSHQ
jgi:hypothetical protein